MNDVTFIYVCYHSYSCLLKSIQTLAASLSLHHSNEVSVEVVIVDNSFFDVPNINNVPSYLSILAFHSNTLFKRFQYIASPKNLGFASACNIGIARSSSPFKILCNCDIIYPLDFIPAFLPVLDKMAEFPDVLIAGPRLLGDSSPYPSSLTYNSSILFLILKPFLRLPFLTSVPVPAFLAKWIEKCWSDTTLRQSPYVNASHTYVTWVSGAFMILSPSFFDFFRGLDERFFLYYEDIDICISVSELSKKVAFFPSLALFHPGGYASSSLRGIRLSLAKNITFYYHIYSWLSFIFKWRSRILRTSLFRLFSIH